MGVPAGQNWRSVRSTEYRIQMMGLKEIQQAEIIYD